MRIDFHTHAFPDALAARAIPVLSHAGGGLVPHTDGTVSGLIHAMDQSGIHRSVLLNIATKPTQQTRINDFAAQVQSDRIIPFGSIHPDAPDVFAELERIQSLGLKGVKLHPEYQGFYVDDDRMLPIYRKIGALGLITAFHAGMDIGYMPPPKASPARMAHMLNAFDGAPVIAAHMGGYMQWDEVIQALCGMDIYLDTSFTFGRIPKPIAQKIIDLHGVDRILFGTDSPWNTADCEARLIESLDLSSEDKACIFCKNATALLKIPL